MLFLSRPLHSHTCHVALYTMHPCNQFLWSCHHFSLRPAGNPSYIGGHALCLKAHESDIQVHVAAKGRKMAYSVGEMAATSRHRRACL